MKNQSISGPEIVAKAILGHALQLAANSGPAGIALSDFQTQMAPWGADAATKVLQGDTAYLLRTSGHLQLTPAGASELPKLLGIGEVAAVIRDTIGATRLN